MSDVKVPTTRDEMATALREQYCDRGYGTAWSTTFTRQADLVMSWLDVVRRNPPTRPITEHPKIGDRIAVRQDGGSQRWRVKWWVNGERFVPGDVGWILLEASKLNAREQEIQELGDVPDPSHLHCTTVEEIRDLRDYAERAQDMLIRWASEDRAK